MDSSPATNRCSYSNNDPVLGEAHPTRERLFDSFTPSSIRLYWLLLTAIDKTCLQLEALKNVTSQPYNPYS